MPFDNLPRQPQMSAVAEAYAAEILARSRAVAATSRVLLDVPYGDDVLPKGFHRIRHYGLLTSAHRKANVARARELLAAPTPAEVGDAAPLPDPRPPCPCCGGRMIIIEIISQPATRARAPPSSHVFAGMPVS